MLKMIHGRGKDRLPAEEEIIYFKDAAWPAPFLPGLEYNSPCHGTWNIVHIGMAVPGAHQIYVCGSNCNRGVVLTAAEMKASDRYSTLTLFEDDLINGDMENLIIEGVTDILTRLDKLPSVVLLFTVCVHRFMGVDLDYVYTELRERYPEVVFVESYMEPISQKDGLTPEQRLRDGMCSFLTCSRKEPGLVSIIGSDFPMQETSGLMRLLKAAGCRVLESSSCKDIEEYRNMGSSSLIICPYPTGLHAVKNLSDRLGIPYLYLPVSFTYDEIDGQLAELATLLSQLRGDCLHENPGCEERADKKFLIEKQASRAVCEEALVRARELIGDTPVAIDAHAVPRYLGLARLLLSHGFHVTRLYGDAFSPEEREDYEWLLENAPDLTICSMTHPAMRTFKRGQEEKVLAIGQKAAYFHQTPFFVNMVQGEGLHGYEGILRMVSLMEEAFLEEKDTKDLVGRKGLGCETY